MADDKPPPPPPTTPPSWIDTDLIQQALRQEGVNLQVTNVDLQIATTPGDNYSSTLYRAKIVLTDGEERSLLVKAPPEAGTLFENIAEAGYFARETTMLAHLVPEMEALLAAASPQRPPPLAARCPLHGARPSEFLVLEDLAPQGFKMAERRRGLGLRHCLLALQTLARLHAASAALLREDPSILQRLGNPWDFLGKSLGPFTKASLTSTARACRTWPGFEEYAQCLEAFKDVAMKKFVELQKPQPDAFNVVIHGDFWNNNMMFRYEDEQPVEMRMVDLQISYVASPALDLLYFLSTSPSENVSRHYEDLLVNEYHYALSEAMELLQLRAPSLEALHSDMHSHGAFALFGSSGVLPLVRAKMATDINATMKGNETSGAILYEDPDVKKWLKRVLPEYRAKGWLPG